MTLDVYEVGKGGKDRSNVRPDVEAAAPERVLRTATPEPFDARRPSLWTHRGNTCFGTPQARATSMKYVS